MKYLTAFLLILLINSCQTAKTLTYEEGLKNCDQILAEKKKKNPNEFLLEGPECLIRAQIPEFEAYTMEGKKINRELLKGKLSILNFWFTTCAPCVAEIPGLDSIVQKFGTDKINGDVIDFIHSSSGKAYGVVVTPLNGYYIGRFVKVVRVFG